MTPTLHVLTLPHTSPTREFNLCAYTSKTRRFATMMHQQGYKVILYGCGSNEAECAEFVKVLSAAKQRQLLKDEDWYQRGEIYALPYDETNALWRAYNDAAIKQIAKRIRPHDIICLPSSTHAPVMDAFPAHMSVETGIGYERTCAPYRVFESRAWMATVYGHEQGAANADGKCFDCVIPNFFETVDLPAGDCQGNYFLLMSRMTSRKGYEIAIETTRRMGAKLLIAGAGGDHPEADHVEYVGLADTKRRAELMGGAKALFCPTLYLEPFGGVVVEAAICGTPSLTTDFGAFGETVEQGVTGYRCRSLGEFQWAAEHAGELDRGVIRERAIRLYSTENVGPMYERYFRHLGLLWGQGFYDETPTEPKW